MTIERKTLKPGPAPACKILAAVLDRAERAEVSVSECERMVEAGKGSLYRFAIGERVPSTPLAVRIRDVLGVPVEGWDVDYKKHRKADFL